MELPVKSLYVEEEPEQMSWFCKDSNISKVFNNVNLRGGSQAGNITKKGSVSSYHQCIGYCCEDKRCNVAMILRNDCFLVACKTYLDCLPQKTSNKDNQSQIVYVNWQIPKKEILTKGQCTCNFTSEFLLSSKTKISEFLLHS